MNSLLQERFTCRSGFSRDWLSADPQDLDREGLFAAPAGRKLGMNTLLQECFTCRSGFSRDWLSADPQDIDRD
jgi:hypothetical protein